MDLQQFEQLAAARYLPLAGFFRRHGVPGCDVEELAQESLLICWTHRERVQPGRETSFLYGVARNLLVAYQRQQGRRRAVIQEGASEEGIAVQSNSGDAAPQLTGLLASEQMESLRQVLDTLPDRQRAVIQALYFDGMTEVNTAESLGITRASVRTHHRRALARLNTMVGPAEST